MAQSFLDPEAFSQLGLSVEQKALLDTVDKLRSQGVGEHVSLPQIIVVGDQSSGKSSVLEAISRIRFPVKGGVCTRFPTEVIVRTSPREEALVEIHASNAVAATGKEAIFSERRFSSNELPDLIERAKAAMGIENDAGGFSEDTLRIEVSGPNLPSLTLVDLPGIYRNVTFDQPPKGKEIVWRLVEKYMKQGNSIILAVVNASNDYSNQGILTEVVKHDPNLERTMGVVTNPDRLTPKSIEEGKYVRLIRNQEPLYSFKHGWHVLRNRGPDDNDEQGQGSSRTSDKARDEAESVFFSTGIWDSLPSNTKGVGTLREKLSKVLTRHIQLSLPGVIDDIEQRLGAKRESLARLGRPRTAPADLRHYLNEIAENFRDLTRLAAKGTYDDPKFFRDPYANDYPRGLHEESDARKLRAVVRGLNHAFDTVISSKGAKRNIIWEEDDEASSTDRDENSVNADNESSVEDDSALSSILYMDLYDVEEPEDVTWAELKRELEKQASRNQNRNFPGSPNDMLALYHFRDQSRRWRSIAAMHLELVVKSANAFVELALDHITAGDESTRDALLREYVDPFFEQRTSVLKERLDELLWHYERGEALTLETEFIRILSVTQKRRVAQQVNEILTSEHPTLFTDKPKEKLSRRTIEHLVSTALEKRVSRFGLAKVVDMATVYYEMSLRTFTENVIILAVENCLISKLPSMLTSSMVHDMDEEMLLMLAAESPAVSQERLDLERDIGVLTKGLRICKRQRPRESTGLTSHLPSRPAHGASGSRLSNSTFPENLLELASDLQEASGAVTSKITQPRATTSVSNLGKRSAPKLFPAEPLTSDPNTKVNCDSNIKPGPSIFASGAAAKIPFSGFSFSSSLFASTSGLSGANASDLNATSTPPQSSSLSDGSTSGGGRFGPKPKTNQAEAGFGSSAGSLTPAKTAASGRLSSSNIATQTGSTGSFGTAPATKHASVGGLGSRPADGGGKPTSSPGFTFGSGSGSKPGFGSPDHRWPPSSGIPSTKE